MSGSAQRGSMLPLVAAVMVAAVAVALLGVELAARAVTRADTQTAADAAALAGVYEGVEGAEDLAARNGAELVDFETTASGVRVRVRIGAIEADASAELASATVDS